MAAARQLATASQYNVFDPPQPELGKSCVIQLAIIHIFHIYRDLHMIRYFRAPVWY